MKRTLVLLAIVTFLLLGGAVLWLNAAPFDRRADMPPMALQTSGASTIGPVSVTPNVIAISAQTEVTVTVLITHPDVITAGVNLLRLNATGSPIILGVMRDDGLSGDTVANDRIFSLRTTFKESSPGQIKMQVSAALRGMLKRAVSVVHVVDVWRTVVDRGLGLSISYPDGWTLIESAVAGPDRLALVPPDKAVDQDLEYAGDILVEVIPNPSGLDLETFYRTVSDVNYLATSSSFTRTRFSNLPAMYFLDVPSMIPTNVIAIHKGASIIEVSDVGKQHYSDNVLYSVANNIK